MKKILDGIVVSTNMKQTAIVSFTRKVTHPLYKRLVKKDKRIKADIGDFSPKVGDRVRIVEVRPISATKHFKIMEVLKDGSA